MSQIALINPVNIDELKKTKPLSKAEERFVACMAAPRECEIGDHRPEFPADDRSNVVRADLIRFFAWGGDNEYPIKGNTIALYGACVEGDLNLTYVPSPHALMLLNCHFSGLVMMSYARFHSLDMGGSLLAKPLIGQGMHIDGDLLISGSNVAFVAECGVSLIGANIGGDLYCHNSRFKDNNSPLKGTAIIADRIKTGGNVFLRSGFKSEGGVRFIGANIAGDLDCNGGNLNNENDYALFADKARIGGNFLMGQGDDGVRFCANGGVHLISANITGNLDCGGGEFIDMGKGALVADGAKIGGELRMNSSGKSAPFFANGNVRLVAANIGVSWGCIGGMFSGDIAAESVKIGNSMFWKKACASVAKEHERNTVNLQGATVDIFDYDEQSRDGFDFILDGFAYRQFAEHKKVESRIKWLNNRPARKPFSPQPFEHAAKVLFAMGYSNDAREVLLKKERRLTKNEASGNKFWRQAWDLLACYGYHPKRTLWISLFCLMIGWGVFCVANLSHYIVPHQPVVMADERYRTAVGDDCPSPERPTEVVARLFPEYPKFSAFLYSLDVFIPFFALHQESHWYPLPPKACGNFWAWALWVWYCLEIIAGWVLTSLLVLSLTGLLRPRQSSGGE